MEPLLFAIVDDDDHDQVICYGIDLGEEGAYTVRRDPDTRKLDFGAWESMDTAFERFHRWFSSEVKLHLIVYTVGDPEDTDEDPATDDTTVAQLPEEASVVTHNK